MPAKINRLNEIKHDKNGILMKIVNYINYDDIYVQFLDEYQAIVHTNYSCFKKGTVKNPYYPSVYNVGYLGQGEAMAVINKEMTKPYCYWKSMLNRCYCNAMQKHTMAYVNVTVCKEWHNYQNFAKWFEDNYYEIEGETMCLDKDIIGKNKHFYSPETCIFVPQKINGLFVFGKSAKTNLPLGVYFDNSRKRYVAQCGAFSPTKHIGQSANIEEAFLMYKKQKEKIIQDTTKQYEGKIPQKIFDILMNYEVEKFY